jgi:toxin ParE1/3/4
VNVILREDAWRDVIAAFEWYEERRAGLGVEYRDALDATVARILRYPVAFEPGERGLRRALVSRFSHVIYFRVYSEALVVVGVLHAQHIPPASTSR